MKYDIIMCKVSKMYEWVIRLQREKEIKELAFECMEEGRKCFHRNKIEQAALLVQNAVQLYKSVDDVEHYTVCLNLMGVIYAASGNETMSVDCYLEGLEYALSNQFRNITCLFYNNIGSRYQQLNEHKKAIQYFEKATTELQNPECSKEERYEMWCLITYLNLAKSYCKLKKYQQACRYQDMADSCLVGETAKIYRYTNLISKCVLFWNVGEKNFVYQKLDELMESGTKIINMTDYVEDMRELCDLLMRMKEYDKWKQIIVAFEAYSRDQKTVHSELMLTEMWMDYHQVIGDTLSYVDCCVRHAQLSKKQREVNDRERAAAIDIKIELRQKEAERKKAEQLSVIDALTGIGNRYLLERDVKEIIQNAIRDHKKLAVGLLDIDCFKQHNDTYGHIQGDFCLKKVAAILELAVKDKGMAYRFGGDEFVLILKDGSREQIKAVAIDIKERLHELKLENINSSAGTEVTISQGYIAFYPKGNENRESLIEHADQALYYVKENGRNGYHIMVE